MATTITAINTVAAPKPPRPPWRGLPIIAPTQPPADDRLVVDAPSLGDPPANAAKPAVANRVSVPPSTARLGSRPGTDSSEVRPAINRPPTATATTGTRNLPHPRRSPRTCLAPWPTGPNASA